MANRKLLSCCRPAWRFISLDVLLCLIVQSKTCRLAAEMPLRLEQWIGLFWSDGPSIGDFQCLMIWLRPPLSVSCLSSTYKLFWLFPQNSKQSRSYAHNKRTSVTHSASHRPKSPTYHRLGRIRLQTNSNHSHTHTPLRLYYLISNTTTLLVILRCQDCPVLSYHVL